MTIGISNTFNPAIGYDNTSAPYYFFPISSTAIYLQQLTTVSVYCNRFAEKEKERTKERKKNKERKTRNLGDLKLERNATNFGSCLFVGFVFNAVWQQLGSQLTSTDIFFPPYSCLFALHCQLAGYYFTKISLSADWILYKTLWFFGLHEVNGFLQT